MFQLLRQSKTARPFVQPPLFQNSRRDMLLSVAVVGLRRHRRNLLHTTVPRCLVGGGRARNRLSSKSAAAAARPDTLDAASSYSASAAPYGLQMVDYKTTEPPRWTLPPHPPIQGGAASYRIAQYLGPGLAAMAFLGMVYVYFNPDDDMVEYWRQVEQGNVPLEGDDDDDEDDDDDDDEWEDDKDAKK